MSASLTVSDKDLDTMLEIVNGAHDGGIGEPLAWSTFEGLKELVRCDVVSFIGLDSEARQISFDQSVPLEEAEVDDAVFWMHYWDDLSCCWPDRGGDLRRVTLASDFHSTREAHDLGMYTDYLRPYGLEHEAMVCLPGGPRRTVRLLFFRGPGSDFTERDRAILTLLRPHLQHLYSQSELRSRGTPDLTPRQWELMHLVARGYSNSQIARRLFLSQGTVRKHLENIFERLDVTSRLAAVQRAFPDQLHLMS